jgi:hypothetical protein
MGDKVYRDELEWPSCFMLLRHCSLELQWWKKIVFVDENADKSPINQTLPVSSRLLRKRRTFITHKNNLALGGVLSFQCSIV